jgi:hypothetical protein
MDARMTAEELYELLIGHKAEHAAGLAAWLLMRGLMDMLVSEGALRPDELESIVSDAAGKARAMASDCDGRGQYNEAKLYRFASRYLTVRPAGLLPEQDEPGTVQ